jgi:hypothetical protein
MNIPKAISLATDGLLTDGDHHKQWFLEEILKALDVDLLKKDCGWEEGIAP